MQEDQLFGADRAILYLDAAKTTLHDLDGSRERGIRQTAKKFLDSPASTFDKFPAHYIGHIRDLDTNTRAFATWCQNTDLDCELCVVHDVYKKKNERSYWVHLDSYNKQGEKYAIRFASMTADQHDEFVQNSTANPDMLLIE